MNDSVRKNIIATFSKKHFLAEFTFHKNEFINIGSTEHEFADMVIWLEDEIVIFQFKERNPKSIGNIDNERKWFQNKILKKSKEQIKKTIEYFEKNRSIVVKNVKGHTFNLKTSDDIKFHKIIIYIHSSHKAVNLKKYVSKKVGFIHILDYPDYLLICEILDTPIEIIEYLNFREDLLKHYNMDISSEKSILGAFLKCANLDNFREEISLGEQSGFSMMKYENVVDKLIKDKSDYDIEYILKGIEERIYTPQESDTDYYQYLIKFAKMHRSERKCFKERWDKCAVDILQKEIIKPYRIILQNTSCGLIFIPLIREYYDKRFSILQKLTELSKYEFKLPRHIGISFCKVGKSVDIGFCYTEHEWKPDVQLQRILKENYPFRPVKRKSIQRYKFD